MRGSSARALHAIPPPPPAHSNPLVPACILRNNPWDWGLIDTVLPLMTGESEYTPWAEKKSMLVWRGSSTGGKRHYKQPTRQGKGRSVRWAPPDMHHR